MAKNYVSKNVYELAQERIDYLFNEFDNVLVSFSGGKDSSVCLEMCYDYAKKNNIHLVTGEEFSSYIKVIELSCII